MTNIIQEASAAPAAAGPRQHTPSRACYIRGCRRPECKQADYEYMSRIRLDHHRGQRRRTDARQTRRHIEHLLAANWTQAQIARAAGLSHRTICDVLHGAPIVANRTELAILSIPIGPAPLDGRDVDGTGSMRRIQALVAIGWSLAQLAPRLGFYVTDLGLIANGHRPYVRATTADAIVRGYRQLARTPGPSTRARNDAARKGWHGPAAWDDDTIDDPDAAPDLEQPEPELNRNELAELRRQEVLHLAGFDVPPEEIAARLGIGFTTVTGILRDQRRAAA
jgi:transcriptional regulator with XRE-family HTH domain